MDYCIRHGLKRKTFARWMKHLIGVDECERLVLKCHPAAAPTGSNRSS
jgi:hypothetical protein